ncbi:MAG: cupredoxin domain-containing protein [Thermomicrobiales bacterium]
MRSATTKRSSGGFIAFMIGTGATLVFIIAILTLGAGNNPPPFATAAPVAGGSAVAVGGGGNDVPAPAGDNAINAIEKDFAIALDKTTIKAGSITINVKNNGPSPHNIEIKELSKATSNIDPGKTATLSVDLKPGTYTIICNIPGHEQLGMKVMLTVQ